MQRSRSPDPSELRDAGFTLIELLVVIIIIGILAAIAIPIFLNQRQQADDAASKSTLKNASSWEEIYLNDFDTYGTITQMQASEPSLVITKKVTLTLVKYDTVNGYCFSAKHADSQTTWYYDSQSGGIQPKGSAGCPVTTTGVVGDSVTG